MVRADNRYADAYMIPELHTLDQFTSNNVTATTHIDVFDTDSSQLPNQNVINLIGGGATPFPGTAAPGSETPVFWVVYVCTAFQADLGHDGDPDEAPQTYFGVVSSVGGEIALVFLEPIRDQVTWPSTVNTESMLRAMVAVHEIGHEFGLGHVDGGGDPSIMSPDASSIPESEFYFAGDAINGLRNTDSP